jgi:hypothetical protein
MAKKKVEVKKRVEKKSIPKVTAKKRPEPVPEPPKVKEPKSEDKYIRLAADAKQEDFNAMSERVKNGEVKWAYYAFDTTKGYHYYIVLPKNK